MACIFKSYRVKLEVFISQTNKIVRLIKKFVIFNYKHRINKLQGTNFKVKDCAAANQNMVENDSKNQYFTEQNRTIQQTVEEALTNEIEHTETRARTSYFSANAQRRFCSFAVNCLLRRLQIVG